MIDYYKILEIEPNSNEIQIRRAYLKLAKKYHPDINRNDKDAKLKFQMINMAYQFLIKKENRQKYNEKTNTQKEKEEEYLRRKYGVSKGRYNDIKKKQRATKNDTKEYEFKEPLSDNFYFTVMFIIGIIGIVLGIVNLFINEWDGIDSLSGLTFGLMFTAIIVFGWFKFNNKI
ncbi:MAG: hypothetical protein A2X12_11545 [Bacteroidetes bacterium GWE2_29_8]|nr:MAG: hypothetical protein A2X12_11545 [Bacteroidetes bacterium GWE2_29_8]OFY13965.1 MAG: hypothetical protein A2X02_09090 [Bacteroidetes bacterium GWF2_29_10]